MAALPPLEPPALAAYVAALDGALTGPRRVRHGLVGEAADHLLDATDAYRATGRSRDESADLALRDFGTVGEIAPEFQTTLAVAASRRTSLLLLVVLGAQPFLWDGGLRLGELNGRAQGPGFAVLDHLIEVLGFVLLLGAGATWLASGIGHRWFCAGRGIARATASFTLAAAVLMPVTVVGMLLTSDVPFSVVWQLMVPLLFAPLAAAAWSARTCLAASRAHTPLSVA